MDAREDTWKIGILAASIGSCVIEKAGRPQWIAAAAILSRDPRGK
ncbi:MAG: hypothetical protein OEL20_00950 [Sulfuritalea sp.]|jgi:hypothetical protein|nr:hypothetical protein [Sulfuritalea sp.]